MQATPGHSHRAPIRQTLGFLRAPAAADRQALGLLFRLLAPLKKLIGVCLTLHVLIAALEGLGMLLLAVVVQYFMKADLGTRGQALLGPILEWLNQAGTPEGLGLVLLCLFVGCQLLRCAVQFISGTLDVRLSGLMKHDLRQQLFRHFLGMSWPRFTRCKVGKLHHHFDQTDPAGALFQLMMGLLKNASVTLLFLAMLCWFSWSMTAISLLLIALLFGPVLMLLRRARRLAQEHLTQRRQLSQQVLEMLEGFRLVHTFGLQRHVDGRFRRCQRETTTAYVRNGLMQAAVRPLFEACAFVAGLAVFLLGYWLSPVDEQFLPAVITYTLALYRLIPHINQINSCLPKAVSLWPVLAQLAELLERPAAALPAARVAVAPALRQTIRFERLSFRYQGSDRPVIQDLSFDLARGQMTALVGGSGAGKSTILNLLLGFYQPNQGRILVDDQELSALDPHAWRAGIGLVDQEGFLFHASVRDNLMLGNLDASEDQLRQAARDAGADEFIEQLPQGYDTIVGQRGQRLSGGQRQRLAIARALLRDPQLLILDEATSNLDTLSEKRIWEAIQRMRGQRTILCIAHRLTTVVQADEILVLEQGRLVEQGTHAELLARDGVYARLWRSQPEKD